jgi:hypothetical protein
VCAKCKVLRVPEGAENKSQKTSLRDWTTIINESEIKREAGTGYEQRALKGVGVGPGRANRTGPGETVEALTELSSLPKPWEDAPFHAYACELERSSLKRKL